MAKVIQEHSLTNLVRTRPTIIITTVHPDGTVNAGTFGAYTNLGPAEIGIAIGRASHTYQNITRTGEFVINVPSVEHVRALEICGRRVPADQSEVELAGLHLAPGQKINVPIIVECVSNVECRYWREIEINGHVFVMAKAVLGHLDERYVDTDGGLDTVKARIVHDIRYPDPLYAVLGEVITVDITT